jgi:hypothetical protein
MGELESIFGWESSVFVFLGKRLIIHPSAFKISISISSSSLGIVAWDEGSPTKSACVGSRLVAAPVTSAPRAR